MYVFHLYKSNLFITFAYGKAYNFGVKSVELEPTLFSDSLICNRHVWHERPTIQNLIEGQTFLLWAHILIRKWLALYTYQCLPLWLTDPSLYHHSPWATGSYPSWACRKEKSRICQVQAGGALQVRTPPKGGFKSCLNVLIH